MRVLLLTDSLGCPREETPVSETWVDKILNKWSGNGYIFYTYCKHGLSAKMIDLEYVKEINPDVVITQIGIVDACRRALSKRELFVFSHIPLISKFVNLFCKKNHFKLTKIREIHDCEKVEFTKIVEALKQETNSELYFIKIAQPGRGLKNRVYHVMEDVDEYNEAILNNTSVTLVDPYGDTEPEILVLDDGHHLNELGIRLVECCVNNILSNL